jgi:hypothetical protein
MKNVTIYGIIKDNSETTLGEFDISDEDFNEIDNDPNMTFLDFCREVMEVNVPQLSVLFPDYKLTGYSVEDKEDNV